jgi:hypothetical protein
MHVLQWLAVEAEDEETAAHVTTTLLENQMGDMDNLTSWYDWFIVGGGRWNVEVDDGIMSAYTPKTNMIISYAKNPNEFYAQVQECIANRIDTYNEYYKEIEGKDVMAMFANYGGVMSYSLETYPFRNLLRFLDGDWFYDSKFFDLISDSTNATHLLAKLDSDEAKNFFLVPVDFHF